MKEVILTNKTLVLHESGQPLAEMSLTVQEPITEVRKANEDGSLEAVRAMKLDEVRFFIGRAAAQLLIESLQDFLEKTVPQTNPEIN